MEQRLRIRFSTVQAFMVAILLITPIIILFILEILLPDTGSVEASQLDRIFWIIATIVGLSDVVIIALFALLVRAFVFAPLSLMSRRSRDFTEGRPVIARERFVIREVDDMAESVNDLMDAVQVREESLQEMAENLETMVQERTTQLRESAANLQSAREQLMLTEKMAVLGSLVAGVAHELNSPLSIGVTAASFLNERARSLEGDYNELSLTQENLERFLADSEESSRIIQNNLDQAARILGSLKQVAADQQVDEHRAFELGAYINDVLLSLNHQMRPGKHSIHVEADSMIPVDTYPGALTQILNNLVFNSLKHGFETIIGGRIDIIISKEGDDAVIRFSDNGRGLSDEEQDRIFEQFFTTRRGRGGTGLGMSIVKDLVIETLGGSIEIYRPAEGGTGFLIRFPVDSSSIGE